MQAFECSLIEAEKAELLPRARRTKLWVHGVGDYTAASLALGVPDMAWSWDLLSSSRKMGRRGRKGKAAP